jgi:ABC-2 type transport system ATP-binding protein
MLACSLALVVLALAAGSALARDGYVTSFDGTKIVYSFFPAPGLHAGQRAPTVMFGPGYSSARAKSTDATVAALLGAGYNVITWDPRGFGDSGGDVELDSPSYEARDVSALIDRIAQQPEAQLDRSSDPRVGMVGASYGGGIQLTSAEVDPRIDAIAPQISWNSLVSSLDKSNTAKGGWGTLLSALGIQGSTTGGILGGLQGEPAGLNVGDMQDPRIYTAFQDGLSTGEFTPADQAFFAAAGPAPRLSAVHIPVLLMQGTDDTLFTLHEAIANYSALRARRVPVQMLWFCGSLSDNPGVAHGQCLTPKGPDALITEHFELRWLARYLRRDPSVNTGPGFTWISDAGVEHTTPSFPPPSGAPVTGSGSGTLPLATGDTSGQLILAGHAANAVNVPIQTPAPGAELVGEPTLTLTYSGVAGNPDDRLYAQILSDANGLVLGNQVTPIPVALDNQSHTVTIPLEGFAADVGQGSTYTLQITDGTSVYFAARSSGLVTLTKVAVSIPTVAAGAARVVTGPTPSGGPKPPPAFSCSAPTGRVAGRSLGPVALGMTRAQARHRFARVSMRGQRYMDFFCPARRGIRVGYASPALVHGLSRAQAHRLGGRVVLILTANRHYALKGVRVGARVGAVHKRLRLGRKYAVGLNDWYLAPAGATRWIVKVRHGRIEELGLADPQLTTARLTLQFLRSFS